MIINNALNEIAKQEKGDEDEEAEEEIKRPNMKQSQRSRRQ